MLTIRKWHPEPIHEILYLNAAPGGGTMVGHLHVTVAETDGLPDELPGIILTADLQGRERIPPTKPGTAPHRILGREGPRLLGQVVAAELFALCASGTLPQADRLGVVLAGDLWSDPGSTQRGGSGDVSEVWRAFRDHFRWVAGVVGNHDHFDGKIDDLENPKVHLLDATTVKVDGLRVGGVGGIPGNSKKLHRKIPDRYYRELGAVLDRKPDITITHACPEIPGQREHGDEGMRLTLERHPPTLLVCGHCHRNNPLARIKGGTQIVNVDARVVVLVPQWPWQEARD